MENGSCFVFTGFNGYCVQKLQTFHRTKPYGASPLKSRTLATVRGKPYIYDPRPSEYIGQPSYPTYFRNTVLNFQVNILMYEYTSKVAVLHVIFHCSCQVREMVNIYISSVCQKYVSLHVSMQCMLSTVVFVHCCSLVRPKSVQCISEQI